MEIHRDKDLSFEYTCRGNMVAVITDGTRVLGLGDIGPEAAIPVMEGKAAPAVAVAVARSAIETAVVRTIVDPEEVGIKATARIKLA